jgi:RNA polymerase sigma-70 factor (ECF subfamily)
MVLKMLRLDNETGLAEQPRSGAAVSESISVHQMDALRRGDNACWEQLLGRMEARCLALAWRILNDSHLAADAVQTGFMSAFRARQTLRHSTRDQVERWLLTAVANAARDASRSRLRTHEAMRQLQNEQMRAGAESSAPSSEDALQAALAQLDEQSRLTFLLVHQEGFSYQEVAIEFGWPVGTVRSKLHRARMRLRELLIDSSKEKVE